MHRTAVRAFLTSVPVFFLHAGSIAGDPPRPSPSLSGLQERIEASEYEIRPNAQGRVQAPNRAQGFRSFFEPGRIRLEPRVESESSWEWGLTWIAYGRGEQRWPVPEATLSISGARAEYRRGSLVEWYANSPRGLEQGFLLPSPPEGENTSVPLYLDLALAGTLSAIVAADGQAIDFVAGDGKRVLRYAELVVTDALGSKVSSWMEAFVRADARIVRLVLDARDAVFPLTVDPLTTSPVFTVESDQAGANLGASVATAGDVNGDGFSDFIVGVPFFDNGETNEGRALVYLGSASGPVAGWTFELNAGGALLGSSVATAGDVNGDGYADVVVGAPGWDNPENNEGRADLFLGSPTGLSLVPSWTVESNLNIASFGSSVGTAGDVNGDSYADVVVGAASAGRAYLYAGSPSGPSTVQVWEASSTSTSRYGAAVGTAGDVNGDGYSDVIIGAPNYESGQTAEGAVFVYPGSAAGLGATPWFSEGDHAGGVFGSSVGTGGDVNGDGYADVIVGAPLYDFGQADEGLAFLYLGSSTGVTFSPAWFGESDQIAGHYGSSVGTAGDVNGDGYADFLVAGEQITSGQSNEGRAWLYYGGPELPQAPAWTHETNQTGAGIKVAVATAGDVNGDGYADVLVGFPNYDSGQTDEGQVRLFLGSADLPTPAAGWTTVGAVGAQYGHVVAGVGDVNGDGYADVFVSAPYYDTGLAEAGRVFVYPGGPWGLDPDPLWSADGDQAFGHLGAFAGGPAGDVNGDGYDDLLIAARQYDNGQPDEGRASLYLGSFSGPSATPAWTAEPNVALAHFGTWLDTAGDVNGDGYADVVIGAYGYDDGTGIGRGRAFLYLGSAAGLSSTASWTGLPHAGDGSYGIAVGSAGDVNRDGYGDVLVGAPGGTYIGGDTLPPAPNGTSRAYLYLGSSSGLSDTASWVVEGTIDDALGIPATGAGDVNGDGFADLLLGAPFFQDQGRMAVYLGSSTGPNTLPSWTVLGTSLGSFVGYSGGAAGDVNGDGYADLVIGAQPRLYLGSAVGLGLNPARTFFGGPVVGGAGDVNGDGYAEILMGSFPYDPSSFDEGQAELFYGNRRPGVPLIPVQRLADDSRPIARLGASNGTEFRLGSLSARAPFGRGRVKLEVEAKPLGQAFNGQLTTLGSFADTGLTGTPHAVLPEDLVPGTPYHWRMRLRYDPATTPLASRSRWFTRPWRSWSETMLRTPVPALGRTSGLTVAKAGSSVTVSWSAACLQSGQAFGLYEGMLGNFTSHLPVMCGIAATDWTFTPQAGSRYFLVVPHDGVAEGSYGLLGNGTERPPSAAACRPEQRIEACP